MVALGLTLYMLRRNEEVYEFRTMINKGLHGTRLKFLNSVPVDEGSEVFNRGIKEYKELCAQTDEVYGRYSYERMLHSFRPLELEEWFGEEEVEQIKDGLAWNE